MTYNINHIVQLIKTKLECHFDVSPKNATKDQVYRSVALTINDIICERRMEINKQYTKKTNKKIYYLCMEFLLGRSLKNNLFNLKLTDIFEKALKELGFDLNELYELEPDAGLGNGGLGRLAACFLDSAASIGFPFSGYSIMYDYGIFRQKIVDGWQTELPENWLPGGDVWLLQRIDESVQVNFDGKLEESWEDGKLKVRQSECHTVMAVPYDMMISGYDNTSVCILRLWSAQNSSFNVNLFNRGDYMKAMEESAMAQVISKVLYPSDNNIEGKSLRLRQQYFLVSASAQDIIKKHLSENKSLSNLPEQVAIHINETHPALIIPELMRIMMDEYSYDWDTAWNIVKKIVAYTNHTVMSEALEIWPESLFQAMLPRIYEIVKEINERVCKEFFDFYSGDFEKVSKMSIISYGYIHMANLCVAVCSSVNGVSKIHSQIIQKDLFADFTKVYPKKFTNITNGIAHRRWLCQANPLLSSFITELIGSGYTKDAERLNDLKAYLDDKNVLMRLAEIKHENKERLASYLRSKSGIIIDPSSIYDVQVKRLHEYKRQTLNLLHVIYLYLRLKENPQLDIQPTTYIFGAKAAPSYRMAKQIIRLICCVAKEIEQDSIISQKLRVIFLEDYRVTLAELLMPAAEISEQISLAGTEASGTGNMKQMINGAITIGTLDGANVEICDAVGPENILIFGLKTDEVKRLRASGYSPTNLYQSNPALRMVIDKLRSGIGGVQFHEIADSLIGGQNSRGDSYMVLADFNDYCRIHDEALKRYANPIGWNRMSLYNIASAGIFSSDRAIIEYAEKIWHIRK